MNIIVSGRGLGKTRKLVEISHKENIPILCMTVNQREYVLHASRHMELEIPKPLLKGDLRDGHQFKKILVDEALDWFNNLWDVEVHTATFNAEEGELTVLKKPDGNLLYNGFHKIEEITSIVNGHEVKREKLILPSAVGGIVTNQKGELMLVQQYRPAIGQHTWEIPAGVLDKPELTPYGVLVEELREECGIERDWIINNSKYNYQPTPLFDYFMVSGSSDATMEIYDVYVFDIRNEIVVDDKDVEQAKWFNKHDIRFMLEAGEFVDSKTLLAVMHYMKE